MKISEPGMVINVEQGVTMAVVVYLKDTIEFDGIVDTIPYERKVLEVVGHAVIRIESGKVTINES